MGYSKLHSSLVNSSLWCERDDVRLLFITMLALADYNGDIFGSWGGIARQANIEWPPDDGKRDPFQILMEPDADSSDILRNPENEGKRIEEIEGGFHIINYAFYRGLRNDDDRREQNRKAQAAYRKRNKPKSAKVSHTKPQSAHAEAEAEAEADTKKKEGANGSRPQSVEDWLKELEADKTYAGIDVRREYGKMLNWCKIRKKQATKRRFVNWLNNADKSLPLTHASRADYKRSRLPATNNLLSDEELAEHRAKVRELSAKLRDELKK